MAREKEREIDRQIDRQTDRQIKNTVVEIIYKKKMSRRQRREKVYISIKNII